MSRAQTAEKEVGRGFQAKGADKRGQGLSRGPVSEAVWLKLGSKKEERGEVRLVQHLGWWRMCQGSDLVRGVIGCYGGWGEVIALRTLPILVQDLSGHLWC